MALHHLAERPERDSLAVGQAAALSPEREHVRIVVEGSLELPQQPRLADPGLAGHCDELEGRLVDGSPVRLAQEGELVRPPEEGSGCPLIDVDAVPAARRECLPDRHRLRLSL